MALPPTVADVREWAGVPQADISDDQVGVILAAEAEGQAAFINWNLPLFDTVPEGEIPEALRQALLRRCARAIAARGLPLGTLPTAAAGVGAPYGLTPTTVILPRLDNEVERLEGPFRQTAVA
ncbi:MAG: hypothetical protein J2P59_02045 [Acidimicrobiales bacterium]|nr:hypothetical protein [Acidimicrobiales bacterium]